MSSTSGSTDETGSTDELGHHEDQVRRVLAQIPGLDAGGATIAWLTGGGAHKNFLVTVGERRLVVKLWNTMWEGVGVIPPSAVVMQNTVLAGQLGIGAPVVSVVTDPLALAIDYLPGCTPLDPTGDLWVPRLAASAKALHDSPIRFNNDYNAFAEARKMFASARQRGAELPDDVDDLCHQVHRVETALDLRVNEFVPCHNDLYGPNVLETESGELRLIDYDLSGNGDRCYDLGFAAAYFEMDHDTIGMFCEYYLGENNSHLLARTRLFAVACNWATLALWSVAMTMGDTNDDYDYRGELDDSLRRLHQTLNAPDFGALMRAATR
ncbi:aminoglycoside phosphotransferase family protein [Rhodococcus fascians]|nr:aminoglycoside phosphotransferase family protein [Rhodococcus fascians]MBY4414735.1 aminoglycoside phosphotransferase family protein [Rhodococcus fascians]